MCANLRTKIRTLELNATVYDAKEKCLTGRLARETAKITWTGELIDSTRLQVAGY